MHHEGVTTRSQLRAAIFSSMVLLGIVAIGAAPAPAGAEVTVHSADETLAEWTVRDGETLFFKAPGGRLWELVTDINDPVIRNKGAGAFFPLDYHGVSEAFDAMRYPVESLNVEVFILPYPRRTVLTSSAEGNTIVLSPGVIPLDAGQTHYTVAHELGHVVHNTFLPDSHDDGWNAYRALRGIEDRSVYHEDAIHKDRPHEIFAEDFRALFGSSLANYSGTIENRNLTPPSSVPGLEAFLRALAAPSTPRPQKPLRFFPNPTRAGVSLSFSGEPGFPEGALVVFSVFDVRGRLVSRRSLTGSYLWDGRTEDGAPASPGLYFLRAVRGSEVWVGKVMVAR